MIKEGLALLPLGKEVAEIGPAFLVKRFLSFRDIFGFADSLRKGIYLSSGLVELRTKALTLNVVLVSQPDVVAIFLKNLGIAGNIVPGITFIRSVPAMMKLGAGPIGKEMTA